MKMKTTIYKLIAALFVVQQVLGSSCPPSCICQLERLICRNTSLQLIPENLQTNVTLIDLSFNGISVVYNHDFRQATDVEILFLNNNDIKEVQPYCFYKTKNLTHLYLNNNKISKLDLDAFKFLTRLRHLSLKKNDIQVLDSHIFQQNKDLVMLDLSDNKITRLHPDIFEKNSILSWVNLNNNPLPFSIEWKNLFNHSLNVIDFDFCKGRNTSIIELRAIENLRKNKTGHQEFVSLENFTSVEIKGMSHSEISQIRYRLFRELYDLEFPAISELVIGEDWNVVTLSGETILCYCEQVSAWFWCYDSSSACHVMKSEKYKMLNCSAQNSDITSGTENAVDSDEKKSRFHFIYRAVGKNTLRNTLIYGSIPGVLVIMVVIVFVVKRIRRRKHDEERERAQTYSALRNSYPAE